MLLRRWWLSLLFLCVFPVSAWAVDPSRRLTQLAHAAWRIQDGFFTGSPRALVQTQDGYLWVGTDAGLLRFDGVRFVPWSAKHGERLPSVAILGLLAGSDGSLWIATAAGVSQWKNETLTNYPAIPGGVVKIFEDSRRNIWFGQMTPSAGSGPLCQVVASGTRCFGIADGVPLFRGAGSLIEDAQGSLWIGGNTTLLRWTNGSPTVYLPRGLENNTGMGGILGLAATPDGAIWVGIAKTGPGLGLQRLVNGRWQPFATRDLDASTLYVTALHTDRDGALWVGTGDRGIYRIHGTTVDHFDRAKGLSSDYIVALNEDREGNIWVATSQGLDRFSDTPVISFTASERLCSSEVVSVLATRDGSILIGGDGALGRLRDGTVSCLRAGKGLPGSQVTSLFEDHAGRLWVGLDRTLAVYEHGRFRRIDKPDGSGIGLVTGITEDTEHNIWIATTGPRILMRIEGMAVREEYRDPLTRRVAADPTGGVWLGLANGDLAHYRQGKLETYRFAHGATAMVNQILPDADGSVLAATSYGLIGWRQGKQLTLAAKNGLPCEELHAMTFDSQGHLWLFMDCAMGVLTRTDLEMWRNNPEVKVSIRAFDVLDGVRTGRAPFVAAARSPDGRLWFANGLLLQMIDPAHLRRNAVPPPVHIEQVIADRKSHAATGIVHLPPLTRDIEIAYVGLSFAAPQKVLFRYRLEGRDKTWQEPGTRRQAFYNDLRPGTYHFRVIASNNDGVWNEHGAALDIVIAPAWYQTTSFLLLSVATSVVAMYALYQLRMRQIARSLTARFDDRLAERTRVARELHDTLLQTVQGSKLVADHALARPEDTGGMRRAMEQVSGWLGQASTEGRAAVNALRASTTETNDLANALQRAIEECGRQGSLQISLVVAGDSREMHPVVRDEVYRIGTRPFAMPARIPAAPAWRSNSPTPTTWSSVCPTTASGSIRQSQRPGERAISACRACGNAQHASAPPWRL